MSFSGCILAVLQCCALPLESSCAQSRFPTQALTGLSIVHRNLAGEIGEEWEAREGKGDPADDLLALVKQIVPYHMGHNAETDAVDLLLEVSSSCSPHPSGLACPGMLLSVLERCVMLLHQAVVLHRKTPCNLGQRPAEQ